MKITVSSLFLLVFFVLFILFNILVGMYMVDFVSPVSILTFIVIEFINILIAYRLSEFLLSIFIKDQDLPKLDKLTSTPKVALLYLTYNDAMPEVMARLKDQKYDNYDVFIVDDSTDEHCTRLVDSAGYKVVRRDNRKGYKAGAINNWLQGYGQGYKYFIILDSDSILDENFTETMVRYADHPQNSNVAVFQSKWRIWNVSSRFPRVIGVIYPLWFYSFERLANSYETPLIMGHNNLLRTETICRIGGFDEDYACEDLALSLKLLERGYEVKYVDVIAYESCPETVKSYVVRNIRWGKGTIEIARRGTRKVPLIVNLHLLIAALSYLVYFLYIIGMIIVVFGATSTIEDVGFFIGLIMTGEIIDTTIFSSILIILVYASIFYLIRLPIALKLKIPLKDYVAGMLVSPAMDFYMIVPLSKGLIETLLGKKVVFNVTDKKKHPVTIGKVFYEMGVGSALWVLIVTGVALNPVSFIFNFFWLIPWMFSPFIIYLVQK